MVAPAASAWRDVSSVDPSSTTRISSQGAAWRSAVTTSPTAAPSLYAGMTTDVAAGSAMPRRAPDERALRCGRRGRAGVVIAQFELPDAVLHVLEDLAAARDEVGDEADQHHLDADDEEHRGEDQRLQLSVAGPVHVVVEEA